MCWLQRWQTLIGSVLAVLATAGVAWLVTEKLNTSIKRTEFFVDFTKRYHVIRVEGHKLDNNIKVRRQNDPKYSLTDIEKSDAHQIYFQLFGLIYDEFYAYRGNFLDPEIFVDWMAWHVVDTASGKEIGGVSYSEGWQTWYAHPMVPLQKASPFVVEIQNCGQSVSGVPPSASSIRNCVNAAALRYGP
jgi:hypothetical protein